MQKGELVARKPRSDKKRDIKPTVSIELKDSIARLNFIIKKPMKDVAVDLLENALYENDEILQSLIKYVKREVQIKNSLIRGSLKSKDLYDVTSDYNERISFRVSQSMHDYLAALAYAFDCSISKISAVLIYESIKDGEFIERYIDSYLEENLDKSRKKELKALLKYIRREAGEPSLTMADLMTYLIEEPIKWVLPNDK